MNAEDIVAANRAARAYKLAAVLHEHRATAAQAQALPQAGWKMAAALAGITEPSPVTQRMTVALMRVAEQRETREDAALSACTQCGTPNSDCLKLVRQRLRGCCTGCYVRSTHLPAEAPADVMGRL